MTLLGNYSVLRKCPGRFLGGNSTTSVALGGPGALGGEAQLRSNWNQSGAARGMFTGEGNIDPLNAKPNGYRPGYGATVIQVTGGGMATYTGIAGLSDLDQANLAGVKEAVAAIIGEGVIGTADLLALGNLISALTGEGQIANAAPTGVLEAVSALVGSGTLAGDMMSLVAISAGIDAAGSLTGGIAGGIEASAGLIGTGLVVADLTPIAVIAATLAGTSTVNTDIIGIKEMVAALNGTGTLSADTTALANLMIVLAGTGVLAGDPKACGYISAEITPFTDLSPEGLARAVWNEAQSEYAVPGSFGDNLDAPISTIGGGSITEEGIAEAVWDEATADHTTDGTYGALVKKLLTVAKFLGLK